MSGPAEDGLAGGGPLADALTKLQITRSSVMYRGMIWDLLQEEVDLGPAGSVQREFLHHPGAVTIAALDEQDQVLMIRQYRHPVRMHLWELPAGLLDVAGEPPLAAAQRELAEEADLTAGRWDLLTQWFNSPGGSDEANRVFLARDIAPVAEGDLHTRTGEEHDMPTRWVPLDQAREAVLSGRLNNPGSVIGILAACAARDQGWATLLAADTPWPAHHAYR